MKPWAADPRLACMFADFTDISFGICAVNGFYVT
jgi:hypothetical protein